MTLWTVIAGEFVRYPLPRNANSGTYYLKISGSPATRLIALPEFLDATNTLRLELYTRPENYTYTQCGTFDVGYMTDLSNANSFVPIQTYSYSEWTDNSYKKKAVNFTSAPANAHIAIRHNAEHIGYYWFIDDVSVIPVPECLEPTGVQIQEGSLTAHGVTIEWDTAEGTQFQWGYKLATAPATEYVWSDPITSNSCTLNGLEPETEYTFYFRKYCSDTEQSEPVSFNFSTLEACPAPTNLEITDIAGHSATFEWIGTSQNQDYKVFYRKAASFSPLLTEDFENGTTYNANWTVVNLSNASNGDKIGRDTDAAHQGYYGFRFSSWSIYYSYEEYLINKNALSGVVDGSVIEFYYKKSPSSSTESFKVGYSSTNNQTSSFTFGDNHEATGEWQLFHELIPPGTKYVAIRYTTPTNEYYLYIDDISICLPVAPGSWNYDETSTTPFTIHNLLPETQYDTYVQGLCGSDGDSDPSETVTFTTTVECPTPSNFTASHITSVSADLSWEGNSEVESYTLRYRTAEYIQGFNEQFSNSTLPSGWTRFSGVLNSNGTVNVTSNNAGWWYFGTNNNAFDSHAYINLFGTKNYWLETPSLTIGNDYYLNFDVAYTKSLGNNIAPVPNCTSHRFVVLISLDNGHWTILREWNNTGSSFVLDNISPYGQNAGAISLASYAGQTVRIAFFAHSENQSFDNNIHIDNVGVGQIVYAGSWQTVIVPGTNSFETGITLTSLNTDIVYESQVKSNCSNQWCDIITFKPTYFNQTTQLAQNWNWWAPTVQVPTTQLQNAIGNNLLQIKTRVGTIGNNVVPGEMYLIQTSAPSIVNLTGIATASVSVIILPGYNWFGYSAWETAEISEVFDAAFEPTIGDKIISQDEGFAIFNGTVWEGTLTNLVPGTGYVYVSNSTESKTLLFELTQP